MNEVPLAATYLLLIIAAILFTLRKRDKELLLKIFYLSVLSILPLGGVIAVSLISPKVTILINRIILVFAPPIIVLAAIGLASIPNRVFAVATMLLSSAIASWWLYSSSYYTVPTKADYRGVAREVARLQKEHNDVLLISLDRHYATMDRGAYYWNMFGVHSGEIFLVPENLSPDEVLRQIRMKAERDNIRKIVLFSQDFPFLAEYKDMVNLCDKYFRRESESFSNTPLSTLMVSYSLQGALDP